MTNTPPTLVDLAAGSVIPLPPRAGMPRSAHVIQQAAIDALNAALVTGRPLLVRGEPGTGKSQLARAAAEHLRRAFLAHAVDGRTETRDLLFTIDAVSRLAEAQIQGALPRQAEGDARRRVDAVEFLHPGPLWWAFEWGSATKQAVRAHATSPDPAEGAAAARGVVLLVDEIDKADPAVPNGLLDALGHRRFDVPGHGAVRMDEARPPLVVFTTNEERALPDAFLRRCLVLHLRLPRERQALVAELVQRGRAHFERAACSDKVLAEAASQLAVDRERARDLDLSPPGLAEYIDLLDAVTKQRRGDEEQIALLARLRQFAFHKHEDLLEQSPPAGPKDSP